MMLDGVAVVLGAAGAGNMGQAIAKAFAAAGAKLVVSGRRMEPLEALAGEIGGVAQACDITRRGEVDALFAAAGALGPVKVAVNASGWGLLKGLHDITDDELDAIVALQFTGVHHFLRAAVRAMTGGGSIIQISSATVVAPVFDHAAYIGTKAGGEALVRAVAHQYGAQGIRANVIAPGLTASPMTAGAMAVPGLEAAFAARVPLGRVGTVEDVAEAALWLAGDGAFVTGQVLQVNGGLTLRGNPLPEDVGASIAAATRAG